MLNDEILEKLTERLVKRIEETNLYAIKKIGNNIGKFKTVNERDIQVLANTLKYGGSYEKIVEKISKMTDLNRRDIEKIFEEVAKTNQNFSKQFYDYKNVDYIPYAENYALQNQVKALANVTANTFVNMCNTSNLGWGMQDEFGNVVFRGLKEAYYEAIDKAVLSIYQGKDTFDNQMYKTLKDLGGSGLRTISPKTYTKKIKMKDGTIREVERHYSNRLDTSVRMNMMGALRDMSIELQKQFGEEYGSDGVEVTVHEYPAPDHAEVQGKQFSNEEFEKFQNDQDSVSYDGVLFPAVVDETGHDRRSIGQYNCYHYVFSILLGISTPAYSNEELNQIKERNENGVEIDGKKYTMYEATQLQRKLESAIREQKDIQVMANASGNEKLIRESQTKLVQLKDKYNQISKQSGLSVKKDRLRVSGYQKVKVTKPTEYKTADNRILNKLTNNTNKVLETMDKETFKSLLGYTRTNYLDINSLLLGKTDLVDPRSSWGIKIKEDINRIDKLFDNTAIGENLKLFKGTSANYYSKYEVGDIIDNKIFMSTSTSQNIANEFVRKHNNGILIQINAKKNVRGLYMGDLIGDLNEKEIILHRKVNYRVIHKTNEKIILEAIDDTRR